MFCDVFYVRTFGNITLTSFGIDSISESNTEARFRHWSDSYTCFRYTFSHFLCH